MEDKIYSEYCAILAEELQPAMGCTEPIAVAYCAALARKTLGCLPEDVQVYASANIIKNVKSVVVPNTGGQRGLTVAAAAGIVAGDADAQLQVLAGITPEQVEEIAAYEKRGIVHVHPSDKDFIFDIQVRVSGGGHTAFAEIAGFHTNVIRLERDGEVLLDHPYTEEGPKHATDRSLLTVERIVEFADTVKIEDVQPVLQRQIDCNTAIAREGLQGQWGANIGRILLESYGDSTHNRAKAWAAAGSDARMNGCELPVVINSGSGNQGLTASLPVIIYARALGSTREELYRALVVSNLVTIHLKTGIGSLSAYCGATAAGCGAGAGGVLPARREVQGDRPHHRQRGGHRLGHDLRRCQGQLRGQDRLGGGGGPAGLEDAAAPQPVLRRRRHCRQGRREHHPQRGHPGQRRHAGDRPHHHPPDDQRDVLRGWPPKPRHQHQVKISIENRPAGDISRSPGRPVFQKSMLAYFSFSRVSSRGICRG